MADRIETLQTMLETNPKDPFCHYGLAMEYLKLDDAEAAVQHFDSCLELDPDYLYAYFHKARALEQGDHLEVARETLEKGLARSRAMGDQKATDEMAGYLDLLT